MHHHPERRAGGRSRRDDQDDLGLDLAADRGAADVDAIAPPPRARPAVRMDLDDADGAAGPAPAAPAHGGGDLDDPADDDLSARVAERGDARATEAGVSSRRLRLRPAGLRSPTPEDRRTSSGRLTPVSPPHRVPHPRAVSGPPRPPRAGGQGDAADSSGSLAARSGARRKVASSQSLPAAASGELSLDAVLGDEPILVVDELPPSRLFGEGIGGWGRAVRVRLDTLAIGGLVGAVLLTVAFLVGRGTGPTTGEGAQVARADTRREISLAVGAGGAGWRGEPAAVAPAAPPHAPAGAGSGASAASPSAPPGAAPAAAAASAAAPPPSAPAPSCQIRALTAERSRAPAVKAFLEERGLRVYLDPINPRTTIVRVGAYASMSAPDAVADLQKVRALRFDGRALDDAYFVPWKAGL